MNTRNRALLIVHDIIKSQKDNGYPADIRTIDARIHDKLEKAQSRVTDLQHALRLLYVDRDSFDLED